MPLDIAAVARTIGGRFVSAELSERTPVEDVSELSALVVGGHAGFATLITAPRAEILARLATDAGAPLEHGVVVTDEDDDELRGGLAARGVSAILGARIGGLALRTTLAALIAEDRAAGDRLVSAGMKVLTQVARRGGVTAVIAELAHRINGWAVLLDTQGQLITSAGAGRLHITDAVAVALGRPVRVRHTGLQVHQVGSDRDLAGYLVIAARSASTSHARDLASLTSALLDLLLRRHDASQTDRLGRESLVETLLGGGSDARDLLRRWGVHDSTLTGFALGSKTRNVDLERLLKRWFDELGAEYVFAASGSRLRGFVREDLIGEFSERVRAFIPVAGHGLHLGLGDPAPSEALAPSAVQAAQALGTALESGASVLRYTDLPSVGIALSALTGSGRTELVGLLEPVLEPATGSDELAATLRVYLAEHGGQRASAARLGIHRQTLVSRIRRIERLTGLDLSRPDDRAVAWLALRAAGW